MPRRGSNNKGFTPPRGDVVVVRRPVVRSSLSLLEDNRLFHPLGDLRPPRAVFGKPRVVIRNANNVRKRSGFAALSHRLGFKVPKVVARCVRRKERREVMFAKRKTGKGSRGKKHFNFWSSISC